MSTPKKLKYVVGQVVTLPAVKVERVKACKAVVLRKPNANGIMEVCTLEATGYEICEVMIDKKTGAILPVIVV